jgi:UV DNA damage endonuclease
VTPKRQTDSSGRNLVGTDAKGGPLSAHRLGVATRIIGAPLRPHDSRRWQQHPHLSVSLAHLRDILTYLAQARIGFYRLSSNLAPYATYPALTGFQGQLDACRGELALIGDIAREAGIRLTMHPAQYVRLGSADEELAQRSLAEIELAGDLLQAMGLSNESVVVLHMGSVGDDLDSDLERFARRIFQLRPTTLSRIVVENEQRGVDLVRCLQLFQRTGVPVVFDVLHHRCNNPHEIDMQEALKLALGTWPVGQRAKIHFSTPRTELRILRRNGQDHPTAPLPNQHSDFINPFEFMDFLRLAQGMEFGPFDIMLEAKAHDLALLRLREQLTRFAPHLAERIS